MPADLQAQAGPPPLFSFGVSVGTGFFVSEAGDIITAKHVVQGCRVVRVAGDGFEAQTAKIVALDQDEDLALARVAMRPKASLQIAAGSWGDTAEMIRAGLVKGDFGQGTMMGFPGASPSLVVSKVQLPPSVLVEDGEHYYREVEGVIISGLSGGPVLYQNNQVAGVLIQNDLDQGAKKTADGWVSKIGLFVAGPVVREFALRNGVDLSADEPKNPVKAIVHVFCFTEAPNW